MAALGPHVQKQKRGGAKEFLAMFGLLRKQSRAGINIVKGADRGA